MHLGEEEEGEEEEEEEEEGERKTMRKIRGSEGGKKGKGMGKKDRKKEGQPMNAVKKSKIPKGFLQELETEIIVTLSLILYIQIDQKLPSSPILQNHN